MGAKNHGVILPDANKNATINVITKFMFPFENRLHNVCNLHRLW